MRKILCLFFLGVVCSVSTAWADEVADAKAAFAQGQWPRLERMARDMRGDLLGDFVQYWWLLSQLSTAPGQQIDDFLAQEQDPYIAERLRSAWIHELLRRQDYAAIPAQFARLLAPHEDSQCADWRAQQVLAQTGWRRPARARWLQAAALPAACRPLYEAMAASGDLDEDLLFRRVRLTLAHDDESELRFELQLLGRSWPEHALMLARTQPQSFIAQADFQNRLQRELVLFAIERCARSDREVARQILQAHVSELPVGARAYAWQSIGLQAAYHQEVAALADFARAGTLSGAAREWEARMALRAGDWSRLRQAIAHMEASQAQQRVWIYWQARALQQAHKVQAARRLLARLSDDDDYYGLLARDQLGPLLRRPFDAEPTASAMQWAEHAVGLRRALALRDAGLHYEATQEWNWTLRGASDAQLIAAAELAFRQAWYDRAIYAAERTHELRSLRLRYLAPYHEVLVTYADELHLDPAWVYGLIRQESRFTTVARSGVGARGLMQIMPATAQWVARHLGLHYHVAAMNEVGVNVQLGTYYLKHILDELDDNPVLATAAYNAGPRRARQWQGDQAMEAAVYVESIPFAETRDYVKKVMTNAEHYALAFDASHHMVLHLQVVPARAGAVLQGP